MTELRKTAYGFEVITDTFGWGIGFTRHWRGLRLDARCSFLNLGFVTLMWPYRR